MMCVTLPCIPSNSHTVTCHEHSTDFKVLKCLFHKNNDLEVSFHMHNKVKNVNIMNK